ncbi:MAG TPA: autotransporter-associated beta strand repeat-containing protein [Tepidisphaeraceae bacterium]|jgi:autotransporter-associated beta strand protein
MLFGGGLFGQRSIGGTALVVLGILAQSSPGQTVQSNTRNEFRAGTSLTSASNWSQNRLPVVSDDAVFGTSNGNSDYSLTRSTLTVGSINDVRTGTANLTNISTTAASTLTLGGTGSLGNGVSGVSSDLIYVNSGASSTVFNISGGDTRSLNLVLGQAGSFNVSTGATLNLGTSGTASALNNGGFQLTIVGTGPTTLGSTTAGTGMTLTGAGGLTKTATGLLTINGAHSYSGVTTVSAGILSVNTLANGGADSSIGSVSSDASNLLLSNGTTLQYKGAATNSDRLFTLNGVANGNGVTIDASGTGPVNFTNGGAIAYGVGGQSRTLTLNASASSGNNTLAATINDNGTGVVSVIKSGTGTWVLTGNNKYSGGTTISGGGTLAVGHDNALGIGALTINNSGGVQSADLNARTLPNAFISGLNGAVIRFGTQGKTTGDLLFSSSAQATIGSELRTFAVHNTTTFQSGFSGSGSLTKDGLGTLIINGPAESTTPLTGTFARGITISSDGGNLRLGNSTAAGAALITINGSEAQGGTLQFASSAAGLDVGNTIMLSSGRNDPTLSPAGSAHLQNVLGDNTISTPLPIPNSGSGVLVRSDSGTLTLSGKLDGNAGSTRRAYYLYGAGNGKVTGVIAAGSSSTTTRVVKDGTGKWTLSAQNTYSGQTIIRGGTLVSDGAHVVGSPLKSGTGSGNVEVQSGGTLAGSGGTGGVSVLTGGTITAGSGSTAADTVGTLSTSKQLWSAGGAYAFKIAETVGATTPEGSTAGAGTYWDNLTMTALGLGADVTGKSPFIIKVIPLKALFFQPGAKFQILNITSTDRPVDSEFTDNFVLDTTALGIPSGEFSLSTQSSGAGMNLFLGYGGGVQSAPEPSTLLLLGVGGGVLLTRRRREMC